MTKLGIKKVTAIVLSSLILCAGMLSFGLSSENGFVTASASVLPPEQILPNEISSGEGVYELKGEVVSAIDGRKYAVYRNTKLRSTAVETESSVGHYFNADRGKSLPIEFAKSKDDTISIGSEVAASLGVSAGAEAFGCEATVEVEVTSTLGISASLGQGYTESLTYTLNPDVNPTGTYYIITNAFVRDYRIESYEWKQVQTGTKTVRLWYTLWIATKKEPVYEWMWVKSATAQVCYPESYYYTIQYWS